MAFDVSALAAYTDQNKQELILLQQLTARTADYVTAMPGVKGPTALNKLDTAVTFQVNGCGFNSLDSTTFSQRVITPGDIKVNESLCPKDLASKWTVHALQAGSRKEKESLPFEQYYTQLKAAKIAAALEIAMWQGDTASGTANLNKFDGYLKIVDAAAGVVDGNTGLVTVATGITTSNAYAIAYGIFLSIPYTLLGKEDVIIFCGMDFFNKFIKNVTDLNLFHYTADTSNFEVVIPGTTIKLVAVNGLNGTNRLVASYKANMYYGVDLLEDAERFEVFYAKEADQIRFISEFRAGVQIANPSEVVQFKLKP